MPEGLLAPHDLSVDTQPFDKCPECGTDWKPTLWLVLDTYHRPEFLSAILKGNYRDLLCEACKTTIRTNSPFLVLRSLTPRLLYSPSPGTTSFDDHNQLVDMVERLKEAMGGLWDEDLLGEVAIVPSRLLWAELSSKNTTPMHSLADVVDAFSQADTGWKQQYVLARYPELYEADADAVAEAFEAKSVRAREKNDHEQVASLHIQQGMLASCRSAGSDTIRNLLPSPMVYEWGSRLNELLLATSHFIASGENEDAADCLFEAKDQLTQAANPLLWQEIQLALAELDSVPAPERRSAARQALDTITMAAFPCGPWLRRLAEAHARLAVGFCEGEPDVATRHYESAVEAFKVLNDTHQLLVMYDALGLLQALRTDGDRARHLDDSLRSFEAGAYCVDLEDSPSNWAAMQFNVGNGYLERINGDPGENLRLAIHHLVQAVTVQRRREDKACVQHSEERLRLAYQRAREFPLRDPRSPDLHRALVALGKRDWEVALAAYQSAIEKTEQMLGSVYSEEERRRVFSDFGTAYSATAYIYLRLGQFAQAIMLLEAGRSRILSEEMQAFDLIEEKLPQRLRKEVLAARQMVRNLRASKFITTKSGDSGSDIFEKMNQDAWREWVEVLEKVKRLAPDAVRANLGEPELLEMVPEGGALVLPVLSVVGCCVLVVSHGCLALSTENVLWIDDFTDNDLVKVSLDWMASQDSDDRAQRREAIMTTCEWLWQVLVRHVAARLATLNLARGAPVILLPQGGLGSFPLHAAAPKPDSFGGLLDGYSVSYAPSAYLLSLMRRRAASSREARVDFLGIVDPLGDLEYGRTEGALIASLFEHVTLLEGPEATGSNLVPAVLNKKYVHLSCHAYYTTFGGNYSGLHLAPDAVSAYNAALQADAEGRPRPPDDSFFAGQRWIVYNLKLTQCYLVTLSACESGRVDANRPDEFQGLPAAFLRAGAAAIVSTLWRVDDVAAMLVTRRLYEGLINDHLSPAPALRQAQLWLRDATNQTLYRFYRALREQDLPSVPTQQLDREQRKHAFGAPNDRPYSHPYYWASFVVIGSG